MKSRIVAQVSGSVDGANRVKAALQELDVARAAAVWLAADPDGRAADVGELLQCVRLPPSIVLHQVGALDGVRLARLLVAC